MAPTTRSLQRAQRVRVATPARQCRFSTASDVAVPRPSPGHKFFPYESLYQSVLDKKKKDESYRYFRSIARLQEQFPYARCSLTGKKVDVWCSNDYLAMGSNPAVISAMEDALHTYGANSGGSRNIAGHSPLAEKLEESIAELHKKPAGLYFSSGFAANEAALIALGTQLPGCIIFSDELNHASMIDGIRHAKAKRHIWKHNDLSHLEALLASYPREVPKIIAFESVYSMCGTIAPIAKICDLAEESGAITFMDEAHAIGLYGPRGAGVAEHMDFAAHQPGQYTGRTTMDRVDVISGSVSKGLGTMGGYITGSEAMIDMIRSVARGFIFTTTQSPAIMAGANAAIQYQLHNDSGRIALQRNVATVKRKMARADLPVLPNRSHLVPLMIGDAEITRRVTDILYDEYNIYVQAINSPTVAMSMERVRISPTGAHGPAQQDVLVGALVEIWTRLGLRKASDWQRAGVWDAADADTTQLWTDNKLGLTPVPSVAGHLAYPLHDMPVKARLEDTLL
ncbi:5-aminolevulinate synthase [Aspergillus ellipticus CBS 707.79]|uniref:5-aminolevulinate synthase n=1 Tax=Aspergillus ellipticus CBS 707.79 TaxID=1448320 RepID=A0A319DAH8_9EURO|nr:5-aminolevulinate synthase [Aspergillus ellipticus CBS 707.79]